MSDHATFGVWGACPKMAERLVALHGDADEYYSFGIMAQMLAREFNVTVTRNMLIGKARRMKLHPRLGAPKNGNTHRIQRVSTREYKTVKPPPPRQSLRLVHGDEEIYGPFNAVAFKDLGRHQCRYPLGALFERPTHFCGDRRMEDTPYCVKHYRLTRRAHAVYG